MSKLSFLAPDPAYAELFVSWLNDPEVVKYSEQRHKTHTVQSQLDYWKSPATVFPNCVWIVHLDGKPIGSVSAAVDEKNGVADVGILIGDRSQWGKGYGYDSWSVVCDLLLQTLVGKIEAGCMSINRPMNRLAEKYGMFLEGYRRDHFCVMDDDGLPARADCVLYGKLKS